MTPNWIAGVAFAYDTGSHEPAGFDTIYSDISTFSGSLTYLQDHYQITGTVGYALLGDTKGTVYGLPFGPVQANYTNNGALVLKIQALYRF